MKTIINTFFVLIVYFTSVVKIFAAPNPPPPNNGKGPPPPPGLPIDENISVLLISAVLFGIYVIFKHNQKNINCNLK